MALSALYTAWADDAARVRWLPEPIAVRTATQDRSMRIGWPDGSRVAVYFWAKGEGKSQVKVSHEKLPYEAAVAAMKAFWSQALDRLGQDLMSR
jgi:hypothetical protein